MSTFTPTAGASSRRWQAASLFQTVNWRLQQAWQTLERFGQRRAAPQLQRHASRLAAEGHEVAAQVMHTAQEWSKR